MMLQKTCRLKIQRIASSAATQNFNSTVYWRTVYDTIYRTLQQHTAAEGYKAVSVVLPTTYYLEPNTAEGKQLVSLPIKLPDFTSEWYYVFAVANDKAKAEALKSSLQLAETLRKRIAETGGNNFSATIIGDWAARDPEINRVAKILDVMIFFILCSLRKPGAINGFV